MLFIKVLIECVVWLSRGIQGEGRGGRRESWVRTTDNPLWCLGKGNCFQEAYLVTHANPVRAQGTLAGDDLYQQLSILHHFSGLS